MRSCKQKLGETVEVVLERLLAEGNAGEAQEIVLEVVQVPGNGLAIEAGAGITDFVVEVSARFDLETWKSRNNFAVGFDYRWGDVFACAVVAEEFEKRGVAEIFFEISVVGQVPL